MESNLVTGINICRLTVDKSDAALSLACQVFANGSVLHKALDISIEEYREYMRVPFELMLEQNLSLVAVEADTNMILGCLVACDYTFQVPNKTEVPAKLKPLAALLEELDRSYRKQRPMILGQSMFVDMAVVSPDATGRGIYRGLRETAHRIGRDVGFKRVIGKLSSAATQHVCVSRFGHRVCAEIEYASFLYRGQKPFAKICDPVSIQLVEGELN